MIQNFYATLRFLIIIMIFFSASGCSSQAILLPVDTDHLNAGRLHDGAWLGPITITGVDSDNTNLGKDGLPISHTSIYLVAVCDGKASFWIQGNEGRFNAPAGKFEDYKQHSNNEIHIIYSQHHDLENKASPEWFESQVMLLVEVPSGGFRAQVSRAVVNPKLAETARHRNFVRSGSGTLERTSKECPREQMNTVVKD